MGKRKVQNKHQATSASAPGPEDQNDGKAKDKKEDKSKGKKTYSIQPKDPGAQKGDHGVELTKVSLPSKLEGSLIEFLNEDQQSRQFQGDVSKRLTNKKLTDVYNNLSDIGFSRNQVEAAMSNCIVNGGDLIDALDWLCLNTQNDQLPAGFSESLQKEEEKIRPKIGFDHSLQVDVRLTEGGEGEVGPVEQLSSSSKGTGKKEAKVHMKDWILKYADLSSSGEEEGEDGGGEEAESFDPTKRYTELHSKLQDLKDQAAIAKGNGAEAKHKALSKQLRELHIEMSALEKYPGFNKAIKAELKEAQKEAQAVAQPRKALEVAAEKTAFAEKEDKKDNADSEEEEFGLGLFAQAEAEAPKSKPSVEVDKGSDDVRTFEYTRAQWTGKSPKQFLIDWVRKHLTKSGPPKFKANQTRFSRWKATCTVDQGKEGGMMAVTPDILTQNKMEAEHLSAVLALYKLCKGQAVHNLLPPTYRSVWLEWQDHERRDKDKAKEKQNKPRDQFISKLMKKLKIDDSPTKTSSGNNMKSANQEESDEDDWEALADKGELPSVTQTPTTQSPSPATSAATAHLRRALEQRQSSAEYKSILETRQSLPVFQYRDKVLAAVRAHSVTVVAGETGSGKSTQVPQFLLEDCIHRGEAGVHIVCTQPRRISATSLATRVAQEMGEGGYSAHESLVGYQIRFESRRGPNTRLMYCTTGVVLRQLQASQDLDKISHLIIDEVHERSVQSDFLMVVIKAILQRRPGLKVILMSATLDSQKFSSYFDQCPVINIPGRTFPVDSLYLEDVLEMTGYVLDEDSPYVLRNKELVKEQHASVSITTKGGNTTDQTLTWTKEDISRIDRTNLDADHYSLKTRNAVTRLNLNRINLDLISDLLLHLAHARPYCDTPGAVLVFLPGLADIQDLHESLTSQRSFSDPSRYLVLALHSVLSSQDQRKVFDVPPPGVRKIVLATNIAETGITIPDVVYVIDSGKAKENRYMETSQMSALEEVFISKANCKQRAGRAGRVREGYCFRLYTQEQFKGFRAFTTPELLRVPLEELCLSIMKCEYGKPHDFLSKALDPPSATSVNRAMLVLREVGACHTDGCRLTPLGHHLAALPVDVRIGKMLILAAIFGCLDQIAVIAAAMTDKSPFVVPLSKRSEADVAKQAMAIAQSDHLTLYKAFSGWVKARQTGKSAERSYLGKNFLKRSTLSDIENVKNDLIKLIRTIGFDNTGQSLGARSGKSSTEPDANGVLRITAETPQGSDLDPMAIAMVKAVLTAGLYPQAGCVLTQPSVDVSEKHSSLVDTTTGVAQVHPSSVNKNLTATGSWLVYQEKVRQSRVFLRATTVVSPYALLLFGGQIDVQHTEQTLTLDMWVKYRAVVRTGVIFKELRKSLDGLMAEKLRDPNLDLGGSTLIHLLRDLIGSEMRL